jgi:putative transposase
MKVQRWVSFLLIMLIEYYQAKRCAQIQFMKLQIELLWARLDGNRVILTAEERVRMLRAGAVMDHDVKDVLEIVEVKTYKKWLREAKAGRETGRVGRPKILESIREVIIRLATENLGWGLRRIVGELKKLALRPGRSTVRRVLMEEGVLPDPYRHAPKGMVTPWRSFIKGHMEIDDRLRLLHQVDLDALGHKGGLCAGLHSFGLPQSVRLASHGTSQ